MRNSLFMAVTLCLVLTVMALAKTENKYKAINQGDWAVVLVRSLALDKGRELVKIEDFTALLTEKAIAPRNGWRVKEKLAFEDYVGTISEALLFVNSQRQKDKIKDFNAFLSFLETKIGISVAQLLANLSKTENLRNLSEGIESYLAQKNSDLQAANPISGTNNSEPAAKRKADTSPNRTYLASALITSLADALEIKLHHSDTPDYWNIFSKPASPIMPY
jgi:hypothetical protein